MTSPMWLKSGTNDREAGRILRFSLQSFHNVLPILLALIVFHRDQNTRFIFKFCMCVRTYTRTSDLLFFHRIAVIYTYLCICNDHVFSGEVCQRKSVLIHPPPFAYKFSLA